MTEPSADREPSGAGRMSDRAEPIDSSITPLIATLAFGGRIFARGMSRIHDRGRHRRDPARRAR